MKLLDILKSCEKRIPLLTECSDKQTTAFRLVHGAADHCPGITMDYYNRYLVINQYQGSVKSWVPDIAKHLSKFGFDILGVYCKDRSLKEHGTYGEQSDAPVYGLKAEEPHLVQEGQIKALVSLGDGISTGIFMDQRENRLSLMRLAEARKIKSLLNGFSYTSLFTVAISLVIPELQSVSVDLSNRSIKRSQENFKLNQMNDKDHVLIAGDFLDTVRLFQKQGRRYDMIILDPPTMARNKKGKLGFSVKSHAGPMTEHVMELINPGGILFFSVNTEKISQKDFEKMVLTPKVLQRTASILPMPGQAKDYPASREFPAHLKVIAIQTT